ncbi:MAG TPA: tRNA pseudouridine(55) synthase TruB [Lutibacter sp.]|nr:tRNA pseudouridine(55) synthase TruB [Lutibacter sp.]
MRTGEDFKNGQVLLINKPLTWTSFQVVNKLRWNIRQKFELGKIKVGHAGTLDPLATGLLIICTGNFTKKIDEYQAQIKEYTGEITLGATTPSYDLETEVDETFPIDHITSDLIHQTVQQFVGEIEQIPPMFSAIKMAGVRLYDLARQGKTREIQSRKITIETFEITDISLPKVQFRIVCSKGTYIRSLAYDFGKALNSGGYLSSLRRTKIGEFNVKDAVEIEDFIASL